MAKTELQQLPSGTSDFSTSRSGNQIYIDKTAQSYEQADCSKGSLKTGRGARSNNKVPEIKTTYIKDGDHFSEVLERIRTVKFDLVIGTADIKDLFTVKKEKSQPFLAVLSDLIRKGVTVRLIHAKEPGPNFRTDFDRYPTLCKRLQRKLCPRVHFKIIIFDCQFAYIGSANLTGAALGMKNSKRRNMEAGILTNDPAIVDAAIEHFNEVWEGCYCTECERKRFCTDPIAS